MLISPSETPCVTPCSSKVIELMSFSSRNSTKPVSAYVTNRAVKAPASKQVYAPTRGGLAERLRKPIRIWEPAAQPVASPKRG